MWPKWTLEKAEGVIFLSTLIILLTPVLCILFSTVVSKVSLDWECMRLSKKGLSRVFLNALSAVDDGKHGKHSSLKECISQSAFPYQVWSPVLIFIHTDLEVFVCVCTVCLCAWVCDQAHSLFSLFLCRWTGQYVEAREEEGQPLSTSDGSWERRATICDLDVIPQLSKLNRTAAFWYCVNKPSA